MSLCFKMEEIFLRYDTDKNARHHNYPRQYENLFRDFKDKDGLKFLEIGVFGGNSLRAWRDFFTGKDRMILGVDICEEQKFEEDGLHIEIGNATDKEFMERIHEQYGPFDVILDDGSHINVDVIRSFELLFPLLKDGGLYVIEDTICFKSKIHVHPAFPDHLTYFVNFVPFLNQCRFDSDEDDGTKKDMCIDPFKIMKKTDNVFEYSIDKIEFGCSYIAVSKLLRKHWIK